MKNVEKFVASEFTTSARLLQQLAVDASEQVAEVGRILANCLIGGSKVLVFGNGGSAADAQHFSAELVGRYRRDRPSLPAIALTTDSSVLTAVSNDYGYDLVFVRQVQALAQSGDVVIGISTSGRSANVITGLQSARQCGAHTVALTGADQTSMFPFVDEVISVPSEDPPRVQEAHAVILHILCDIIEQAVCQDFEESR